jgi:hypothetical protein
MRNLLNVASIQPADGDRIYLSIKKEGKNWWIHASDGESIEYTFDSQAEALEAIKSFWGGWGWDLKWHKNFREDL